MRPLDHNSGNLLRAVVRPPSAGSDETIANAIKEVTCWEDTIAWALQHGVLPRLYSRLVASKAFIPPGVLQQAQVAFERNAFHCLANAAELLQVLAAFEYAGIKAIPFKGVVLAQSVYGDITARAAGDLDVLIFYSELMRATQVLRERGYELKTKTLEDGSPATENYFEYHFERDRDGMVLELRWRLELTQPRYRYNLGMDWAWPRRKSMKFSGAEVWNLDPVSSLMILCMHGTKHRWSRLVWICDVANLLESEPRLDWDFVQKEARRVGLWPSLALGVLLASRVAGAEVASGVFHRFESSKYMRKLAQSIDHNLFDEPRIIPDGWIPYNLKILGFWDRFRWLLSLEFLRPNSRDRRVIRLPKSLDLLYYLIRPFRLLLDRSGR